MRLPLLRYVVPLALLLITSAAASTAAESPFARHGKLRVAKSGTHLEHSDGTPLFFLADTCWTGPALSTAADWQEYLANRAKQGFTAIQFNAICPWRAAKTDLEGRTAYSLEDGKLRPNEAFFQQLDARIKAINDAGLLAVPVLAWAHKPGDAGFDLTEDQLVTLIQFELQRYQQADCLYILAGDSRYTTSVAEKWKRIGRTVLKEFPGLPVTTHPTGMNFPWNNWEEESWLTVLGYQSGHGDDDKAVQWLHSGPVAEYGRRKKFSRPVINLEPCYEAHNGYQSRQPHSAYNVRRAVYQGLLAAPVAGFTYGGHGVWSWHTRPGEEPTDHKGTGVAKVWREALDLSGAGQMQHVRKFFESLPWTELRPAQQYLEQVTGKEDPQRFVSCAAAKSNDCYVFYFPAGATAHILLHIRGISGNVRWFDPCTGQWGRPKDTLPDRNQLQPPTDDDWLLVVKP